MSVVYPTCILLFLSLGVCSVNVACPKKCSCHLDRKGRTTVSCTQGGMTGSISLKGLSPNIEVINITAPENNTNTLTMAPIFEEFKHLEELHITRSNIPEIGRFFFWRSEKLDVLNLSENNITQPLDYNFRGLKNLKQLILDDNRIESLSSETFKHLRKLTELSIRRNNIQNMMPRIFSYLSKLRVLKLSGNPLKDLNPVVFKDIQELHELECRNCALQKIDNEIFEYLPQLIFLDLGCNEIRKIFPDDFAFLTNLKELRLDGNELTVISNYDLVHLISLRNFSLANNLITTIEPEAFGRVYNLTVLDLGYNRLENVNMRVFKDLGERLTKLTLNGNKLSISFVMVLNNADYLTELHLAEMGISDIPPGTFSPNLTVLNLSGNSLSFFRLDALPPNLYSLDISRNRFRGLSEEIIQKIEAVPVLILDENPWFCDLCHIVPMLDRANKSQAIGGLRCFSPIACEGRTLGSIKKSELGWCSAPSYPSPDANYFFIGDDSRIGIIAAGASILLLALASIAIIVALCYTRRHAAKYYTHEEKRAAESEAIFDNQMGFLGDEKEIRFQFPMDCSEKKISVSTIDDVVKKEKISNGY